MNLRVIWSVGLGLALTAAGGAVHAQGQPAPPAGAPPAGAPADLEKVQQELREAQEDVMLLRAIAILKLTDAQLQRLLPTLQAAQEKIRAQETADAATLKTHEAALEAARKSVLAGQTAPTRAEESFRQALQVMQTRRARLRNELVASIRAALTRTASQEQLQQMVQVGLNLSMMERQMRWQAQAQSGQGDGGPIGGMTRMLDRLRDIPPADWERASAQFAERFSGGGRGGRDRGRGGPGGGQPDPQRQAAMAARMQQFRQIAEQVRGMSPEQYQQQRYSLASKLFTGMRGGREENPEEALTRFIDRYFLSPRMVVVIREKTTRG